MLNTKNMQKHHLLDYGDRSNSQSYRIIRYNFLLILILAWCIDYTRGIIWAPMPSQINECTGHSINLHWDFRTEPDEEIKQLQWIINSTGLIAYSSVKQGFHVSAQYKGRVEQSGTTGILIHNLSSKDTGNYTFYPKIAWKTPNIQSVWLNVIEPRTEHFCTCSEYQASLLSFTKDLASGKTVNIQIDGCSIQINSSVCCVVGPTISYCENNPKMLCVPTDIPLFVPTSTTRTRIVNQHTGPGLLMSHITKEDQNISSLASGLRSWKQYNWLVAVALVLIKCGV